MDMGTIWVRSGHMVLSKIIIVYPRMTDQLLEFREIIRSKQVSEQRKPDKQTRKLLLYLFTSTRGGFTRMRIIMRLLDQPYNIHQLAEELDLDYKAVQHHMKVLQK